MKPVQVMALCAGLLSVPALPAPAQETLTDVATGASYVLTPGPDGTATLAGTDSVDTYTLKPDCIAEHPIYGLVLWKTADDGWRIEISGAVLVSFAHQPQPVAGTCPAG